MLLKLSNDNLFPLPANAAGVMSCPVDEIPRRLPERRNDLRRVLFDEMRPRRQPPRHLFAPAACAKLSRVCPDKYLDHSVTGDDLRAPPVRFVINWHGCFSSTQNRMSRMAREMRLRGVLVIP